MPPLPSLERLSLKTTAIDYDDSDMDDTTMPDNAEFNTLILQDQSYGDAFGINLRSPVKDNRYDHFRARRALLFNNMMDAVLKQIVFVASPGNPRLFILDAPEDSAVSWNQSFPASAMAVEKLSEGGFNTAYKVNIKTLPFVEDTDKEQILRMTGNANHVVVRRAKMDELSDAVSMKSVLTELVNQARMSELGIGPKMYLAWCMPKIHDPVLPSEEHRADVLSRLVNVPASKVILNVCTVSELFDGDLDSMFWDEPGSLNKDVTDKTENRAHGFWKAVGECIVRACKHGALHFDLKGKNMLLRKKYTVFPNIYEYEVRYTDFDPNFFMILNMQNWNLKNMELCFGMISLYQLLASSRCLYDRHPFSDSSGNLVYIPWDTVNEMAKEAFLDAYTAEHGVPLVQDIKDMCMFTRSFDYRYSPTLSSLGNQLVVLLRHWTRSYLGRRQCVILEEGKDFDEMAEIILEYARSGGPRRASPAAADSSSLPGASSLPDSGESGSRSRQRSRR